MSRSLTYVAGVLLVGELRARSTVEIHDDVQAGITSPADKTVEELETAAGVELALVDELLAHPEANRNTDGVQAQACNLVDVLLGGPGVPVTAEGFVGSFLAESLNASPFVVVTAAADAVPGVITHPGLEDELGA